MDESNNLHEPQGFNSDEGKEEYELPLQDTVLNDSTLVKTQESNIFLKQQSALPSFANHIKLQWKNLEVYVGDDKTGKKILHNFNGTIDSGELMCVMGGSGAGKSTFLNALSGRTNLNQQTVNGHLAINHKQFKCSHQTLIKSLCTFVPQSDELCPTQTVEEALLFYAKLKLPYYSKEKQEKRINYLIDVLHLNKCRNNYIGSESKRGISGGEKRRVSIAAEILNDKDIIFLDEPTSGLDAYTAARTIKTLKQFCLVSNKIIISTIHQPSIEVFYLFDKLILLSNGKLCFNSYISDIDIFFKNKLRPRTNPADIIVFEAQKNPIQYAEKWENSKFNQYTNMPQISYEWENYEQFDLNDPKNKIKTICKTAPKRLQYGLLLQRELQALIRNKRVTMVRLIQVLFFALASGLCYFNIKQEFSQRVQSFFLMSIMCLLFGIVSLLTAFPAQKLLFEREYNSKTYNITPWALSFMIIEIPRETIHMLIFTLITYFMIGLDGNILKYWFNFFLLAVSGGSFGILFGTICKSTVEAAQTVPAALIPLLIFSDAIIRLKNLPSYFQWIGAINPLYYLIRCFYIIEFFGVEYPRHLDEDSQQVCDSYWSYVNATTYNITNICNITYANYSFDQNNTDITNHNGFNNDGNGVTINFDANSSDITPTKDVFEPTNYWNITTTQTEEQQKVELYCSDTASYIQFFERFELDENALLRYWITVLIICLILRVLAILILLAINNNIFSLIYSKTNAMIKCQCISCNKRKYKHKACEKDYKATEMNVIENIDKNRTNDETFVV